MRVRMLTGMAGPTVNRVPGAVYDVPDGEAERLIKSQAAARVADDEQLEAELEIMKRGNDDRVAKAEAATVAADAAGARLASENADLRKRIADLEEQHEPDLPDEAGEPPPVKRGRGRPRATATDQPPDTGALGEPE